LYYEDLIVLAKKSKKDRKKVLNTCALVLRIVADDDLLEDVDLSAVSAT